MPPTSFHTAIVDAFTRRAGEGNRAGVVLAAEGMSEATMVAVAYAAGASETAFALPPRDGADLRLRYFTPTSEIEFCGHATVATFHRLVETGALRAPGRYRLDTEAGMVDVELEREGPSCRVWMATPRHEWESSPFEATELMLLLGGSVDMLDRDLPVECSGAKLFVPLARRSDLAALTPRWDELARQGMARHVRGYYVFTREAADPDHITQGRYFAPAVGVREDPATGSASGPLAEYLALHGVLSLPATGGEARAWAEQGDAMGKPGRLLLEVSGTPERIERARVGGTAVTVMDGALFVDVAR